MEEGRWVMEGERVAWFVPDINLDAARGQGDAGGWTEMGVPGLPNEVREFLKMGWR